MSKKPANIIDYFKMAASAVFKTKDQLAQNQHNFAYYMNNDPEEVDLSEPYKDGKTNIKSDDAIFMLSDDPDGDAFFFPQEDPNL